MQHHALGKTSLMVSPVCMGCMGFGDAAQGQHSWTLGEADSRAILLQGLESGINFFDTAIAYQSGTSEQYLGRALKDFARREKVVVATKFLPRTQAEIESGVSGQEHIQKMLDKSLRNLGMDYVDLYIYHMWDYQTPLIDIMDGLNRAVKAGKVRYIGISNCFAWQLCKANALAEREGWAKFVSIQGHYNLIFREEEREMIPLCKDQGVGLIPWSPLARGFLAGNRKPDDKDASKNNSATSRAKTDEMALRVFYSGADFDVVNTLTKIANERGLSNAQVAYAWLLHKGVTAPIVGASKLHQLDEAISATTVKLSAEEIRELEKPYQPHPVLGHR